MPNALPKDNRMVACVSLLHLPWIHLVKRMPRFFLYPPLQNDADLRQVSQPPNTVVVMQPAAAHSPITGQYQPPGAYQKAPEGYAQVPPSTGYPNEAAQQYQQQPQYQQQQPQYHAPPVPTAPSVPSAPNPYAEKQNVV